VIEKVAMIPRTERGKFRAVICNLSPEEKNQVRRARTLEVVGS
jgi:hypothetical protein